MRQCVKLITPYDKCLLRPTRFARPPAGDECHEVAASQIDPRTVPAATGADRSLPHQQALPPAFGAEPRTPCIRYPQLDRAQAGMPHRVAMFPGAIGGQRSPVIMESLIVVNCFHALLVTRY